MVRNTLTSWARDTIVTCDGKPGKASDLKAGTSIRVTTKRNDAKAAIQIEAIEKSAEFVRL